MATVAALDSPAHPTDSIKPSIWSDETDRIITSGTEEELLSLRGVPGVRFEPVTWEEIAQAVAANDVASISNIGRAPMDLRVYRNFKAKVLERYASLADYMKELLFHYETGGREQDGKLVALDPVDPKHILLWRPPDFPYLLSNELEHHIVWSNKPMGDEELQQFIKAKRKGWEYVTWVNPGPLASIPSVWHAHVVSRRCSMLRGARGAGKPPSMLSKGLREQLGKLPGPAGKHFRSRSNPV